jgi:hypothetical protein
VLRPHPVVLMAAMIRKIFPFMDPHRSFRDGVHDIVFEFFARAKCCATNNFKQLNSKKMLAFLKLRIKCMCMVDRGIHLNASDAFTRFRWCERAAAMHAGRAPGGKTGD